MQGRDWPGRRLPLPAPGWPVFLIVLVVISGGLMAGSMSAGRMDRAKSEELSSYVKDFVQNAAGINFESYRMARNAMANNVIMVAAVYVLGLTVIGLPVTLAILFVRGFVIGFAVGFLSGDMSLGGVLLTLAAVIPHNLIYVPAMCVGTAFSIMFSALLLKRNFDTSVRIWPGFLKYTAVMSAVTLAVLGAGLVEGYITPVITKHAAAFISSGLTNR